ncbi:hypothetical protein [Pelagicoccus mobilis]|uniref:Uncharacterized protein n=1 Tax=Pelagicoccus mobilis TaxID=415221 RepID=A0A934S1V1_9BACT|nr:hypothetical protein [Pelagicoccus mobilis]MBK1877899.1 hypothetical protein [Pelagicoccus mobilis]
MDWLFDNLGKLAPIVIFLLYMISSMKRGGQEEEEPDPQAAERARKIQEEIRRKILERQRGDGEPTGRPPEQPQPIEETIFFEEEPEPFRAPEPPVRTLQREEPEPAPTVVVDPYVQKRREVEAQMEEAKRMQEAALQKAKSISKGKGGGTQTMVPVPIASGEIRDRLKLGLEDRDSLKTAIVLKEVLDTPVAMR